MTLSLVGTDAVLAASATLFTTLELPGTGLFVGAGLWAAA